MVYYLPSITVLLIFACLVAYEYIRDLRRTNSNLITQLENLQRMLEAGSKGLPVPDPYFPEQRSKSQKDAGAAPFVPTGIGPTAIADRELRRDRAEAEKRAEAPAPMFPGDVARHPTPETIRAAAREAARDALYPDGDPRN